MNRRCLMLLLVVILFTLSWVDGIDAQHTSAGELVWAMHVTIAPAWFDPAENGGLITPFAVADTISRSGSASSAARYPGGRVAGRHLPKTWAASTTG